MNILQIIEEMIMQCRKPNSTPNYMRLDRKTYQQFITEFHSSYQRMNFSRGQHPDVTGIYQLADCKLAILFCDPINGIHIEVGTM